MLVSAAEVLEIATGIKGCFGARSTRLGKTIPRTVMHVNLIHSSRRSHFYRLFLVFGLLRCRKSLGEDRTAIGKHMSYVFGVHGL